MNQFEFASITFILIYGSLSIYRLIRLAKERNDIWKRLKK